MDLAPADPNTIMVRAMEGHLFTIDRTIAERMGTIARVLPPPGQAAGVITLATTRGRMIHLTVLWMQRHRNDWLFLNECYGGKIDWRTRLAFLTKCPWEKQFFGDLCADDLMELAKCSCDLNIVLLKEVACRILAENVRGKTPAEITEYFGVVLPHKYANQL